MATLGREILSAGDHAKTWRAVNGAGEPLAPGVYMAAITTPEGTRHVRLVNLGAR